MDDGLSGDVDFDFFEDGNKQSPSRSNSKSPLNTTVNGKPPIPSSSKSPVASGKASDQDKYGDDKSPVDYSSDDSSSRQSYSSDYDSDEGKDKASPKRAVTSINARLPSADSGGRRNAPRAGFRRKSRSDTDSDISKSDSEDSDRDSSSAYSDGRDDDGKKYQNKDSGKVRAWEAESETKPRPLSVTMDSPHRQTSESRPKSSYKRNASGKVNANARRRASRSLSDSDSDSYTSDSESDSGSSVTRSQKSNSDSEITDVSPLQSADSSPVLKRKNHKHVSVISAPRKEHKPFKELPDTSENTGHRPAEGTMEFKLLMQAVAELDSEKQKRIKASSRRVVFAPPSQSNINRENRNYSFSDLQTRNIDQENERLLQEIIRKRLPKKKREQPSQPIRRLPNSAVNRLKDQRRIERENFAFLQRLQNIKPTRGLTKYEQLNEYRRQMQYGVPTGTNSWRPKTPQTPSTYRSNIRSMSSMSSVHSYVSSTASVGSASSRSRPQSAKKAGNRDTRPAWEERW